MEKNFFFKSTPDLYSRFVHAVVGESDDVDVDVLRYLTPLPMVGEWEVGVGVGEGGGADDVGVGHVPHHNPPLCDRGWRTGKWFGRLFHSIQIQNILLSVAIITIKGKFFFAHTSSATLTFYLN